MQPYFDSNRRNMKNKWSSPDTSPHPMGRKRLGSPEPLHHGMMQLYPHVKWELNTSSIVLKVNARMQLLRKVASFDPPAEDLKEIYILLIRSI
jgi:hypothetical protein